MESEGVIVLHGCYLLCAFGNDFHNDTLANDGFEEFRLIQSFAQSLAHAGTRTFLFPGQLVKGAGRCMRILCDRQTHSGLGMRCEFSQKLRIVQPLAQDPAHLEIGVFFSPG